MAITTFSGPVASLNGFLTGGAADSPGVYSGAGAPTFTAAKGSLYLNTSGSGVADRAYINTNGAGTWTAITTVA